MLISLLSVLGLGTLAYINQRAALSNEVQTRLSTIAQLKEDEVILWLNDRWADLRLLSIDTMHREYIMAIMDSEEQSQELQEYVTALRSTLSVLTKSHPEIRRIEILNPDGRLIVSTDVSREHGIQTDNPIFQQVFASPNGQTISEIHRNPENGQLELTFGYTVYEADQSIDNRTPSRIGAIIAEVELSSSLFSIVNNWPEHGDTGKIILVRDEQDQIVVLNPVRGRPNSELIHSYPKRLTNPYPAQLALTTSGTTIFKNGDENVVAAYRPVFGTRWGIVVQLDEQEAFRPINLLARQLFLAILFVSLASWLSAFLIWRRIAQPLSNLIDATQEVAQDNYAVNLRVMNDDEIGMLTQSFQQMVFILEQRKRELQMANKVVNDTALTNTRLVSQLRSLNLDLEEKVEDRTKQLSQANQKLTELDQLKSKFIANVSHELRNPVASLKLYLRLLEKSNDQNRAKYVTGIANQINWLGKLIENILDISQLERGLLDIDLTHVDLTMIVQQIVNTYAPIIEEKLTLVVDIAEEPLSVVGSSSRLTQMITNVLTNAINYTPEGSLKVVLRHTEKEAILMIEDTGIGIAKEDLPHIFEQFYRGKNTQESEISGTGLGLGIIKDIVEIHNGHIEVESEIDVGTRFTIYIPLVAADVKSTAMAA